MFKSNLKSKRLMSVFLVIVMTLVFTAGFATTAEAATADIGATVKIQLYDEDAAEWPVSLDPLTFDRNTTYGIYPTLTGINYFSNKVLPDADRPSVLDASWQAFDEMGIIGNDFVSGWGKEPQKDGTIEWQGVWVDGMFDMSTDQDLNISYPPTGGNDGYWAGDAWLVSVVDADGNVVISGDPDQMMSDLYASNVQFEDGMTITWNYTTMGFYYPPDEE